MPRKRKQAVPKHFVQVLRRPNVGVETTTGRPWIGVDQQVGHGSADARFALTPEQYAQVLTEGWLETPFEMECWRGEHPELELSHPGKRQETPEVWSPAPSRSIETPFHGELWRHADVLGATPEDDIVQVVQQLAAQSWQPCIVDGVVHRLTFLLTGENSYPRPEGLIAGLTQGSTRDLAHLILGEPVDATRDEFAADGIRVFLEFEAGGLSQISIEPTLQWTLPPGRLGRLLETLGTPEFSDAFVEVIEQTGGARRRHEILSGGIGRLIVWDAGLKVQVQDGNIAIAQVEISTGEADEPNEYARTLVPGMTWPATREQLHSAWGPPSATAGHADLYRYGRRELAVHFSSGQANATLVKLTAVMSGQNATMAMPSRSSGNYTIYLDLLGRPQTDATVVYARTQLGAHVQLSGTGRIVTAVEVDGSRVGFARFMDGWSNVARRSDVAFGAPDYYGAHDDVWWRAPGWIHVHSNNGRNIDRITVSQERPTRLDVHAWQFGRDSMEAWRSLSDGASVTE